MIEIISKGVMAIGGLLVILALLIPTAYAVGWYGARVFYDLRRVYHLRVIGYWLDRLEKVGVREFECAEQTDIAIKAVRGDAWRSKP